MDLIFAAPHQALPPSRLVDREENWLGMTGNPEPGRQRGQRERNLLSTAGNHGLKLIGINGFGQVLIESRLERTLAILVLPPAGYGNQPHPLTPRFLADLSGDFIAAHIGHPYIEKRDIRAHRVRLPVLPRCGAGWRM